MPPRDLLRAVRLLELRTRGLVRDVFAGAYPSAFRGRGLAFAEVRPYQPGDDVRTIDWNVSARRGQPHVKVFEEEREQTLVLAVDVSASGAFGTTDATKRTRAAEICAVLAFSAVRHNDRVGLLLFSDRIERFVPPRKGRRHALRLLRDLFAHEPAGTGTRIGDALERLRHALHRRAIVVLVSDFLDTGYERPLRALAARHDVVAVHLRDPREEALPDVGLLALRDAESGRPVLVDTSSRRQRTAFAEAAAARRRATERALRAARVDALTLRTDEDFVEPLAALFRRRVRAAQRSRR